MLPHRLSPIILACFAIAFIVLGGAYAYSQRVAKTTISTDLIADTDETYSPTPYAEPTLSSELLPYINNEYGFSFQYPADYALEKDTMSEDLIKIDLAYPGLGLYRGMWFSVTKSTVAAETTDLTNEHGFTTLSDTSIGGMSWDTYSYDPTKDPSATDQSKSLRYLVQKEGYVYSIGAALESPSSLLTENQVKSRLEAILASYKFTK